MDFYSERRLNEYENPLRFCKRDSASGIMEQQPELPNIPPATEPDKPKKKRGFIWFIKNHHIAICYSVCCSIGGGAVTLMVERGYVPVISGGFIFGMLVVALLFGAWVVVGNSYTRWMWSGIRRSILTVLSTLVLVSAILVLCFRLTHPILTPDFEIYINGQVVTNSTTFLIPKNGEVNLASKTFRKVGVSDMTITFAPIAPESSFSASGWTIVGHEELLGKNREFIQKIPTYAQRSQQIIPQYVKYAVRDPIIFSKDIEVVNTKITTFGFGTERHEVIVNFVRNNNAKQK